MAFCRLFVCNIVVLCVIHNSVGSALLVLTVDGHTRASMRGTSDSTVPALFLCYILPCLCGNWGSKVHFMKKFNLKLLLSTIALLCSTLASAHDFEVDGIFYNIIDESAKTVEVTFKGSKQNSYSNEYSGEVVVPEIVEYHGYAYTVTAIGDEAFCYCGSLTSVKLPNTILGIGNYAFCHTSIADIVIPASVESLGNFALSTIGGLSKLEIPSNVTRIGIGAFESSLYKSTKPLIYIGHGVQTVSERAVASNDNGLNTVYLGSNITDINIAAFSDNIGITKVYCMASTPPAVSTSYLSYYGDNTNMYSNSDVVLYVPYGTRENYHTAPFWGKFPSIVELDYFVVDGISYRVVSEVTATCEVTFDGATYDEFTQEYVGDIVVPSTITWGGKKYTVTSVGDNAFRGCTSLASITLPSSVTSIGEYAFYDCENLTKVVLPSSIESIGAYAFSGATRNIKDLYTFAMQPAHLFASTFYTSLYSNATLYVPYNSAALYKSADYWKDFADIDELGYFEANGFYYSVSSAANFACEIVKSAVEYSGDVKIPASAVYNGTTYTVTGIGEEAFCDLASVTSVTIPESVTYIGSKAFAGCLGIKTLTIPENVVSVGDLAFYGCMGVDSIVSKALIAPRISELTFAGLPGNVKLNCPYEADYSSWYPYFTVQGGSPSAGNSTISFSSNDGLPGERVGNHNIWESPLCYFDTSMQRIRFTVLESNRGSTSENLYNGFPLVAISEIELYDMNGTKIAYSTESVTTNSLATNEGSLSALCDGDYSTYYHSTWKAGSGSVPDDYVYIDVVLPYALNSIKIKMVGRDLAKYDNDLLPVSMVVSCDAGSRTIEEGCCGDSAFWSICNGTLLITGSGVVSSTPWSSRSGGVKNVVVEEGITILPAYIFNNYINLQCVSLPSTLTMIGNEAFKGCSNLASVITAATVVPSLGSDVFDGISENAILTIPTGSDYSSWEQYFSAFKGNNGEALKVLLADAQVLLDNSVEGDNVGEYVKGSKAALQAVINDVSANLSDSMLDKDVELFTNQINAAVEIFKQRVNVKCTNSIKLDNIKTRAGKQEVVSVYLNNVAEITGLQFDVFLPDGVTFAIDDDGYELIELVTERTTVRKHTFENTVQSDGSMRILCYSNSNAIFSGNNGAVLSMTLNVAEEMAEGDYVVDIKNIVLTESGGTTKYEIPIISSYIAVESHIMGDINGDGSIDVADISGLVSIILGTDAQAVNVKAADINNDGSIDVADISGIVSVILGVKETSSEIAKTKLATRAAVEGNTLFIEPFVISAGEEKEIEVLMSNPGDAFTGLQFDFVLPEGIEVVTDDDYYLIDLGSRTNTRKHVSPEASVQEDGSLRVLTYSNKNELFKGESGDVLVITVKAADNLDDGCYELKLKNIVLSRADGTKDTPADTTAIITVGENVTGVDDVLVDVNKADNVIYDLSGRAVENPTKGFYISNGKKIIVR